jgi:hypothetical protein
MRPHVHTKETGPASVSVLFYVIQTPSSGLRVVNETWRKEKFSYCLLTISLVSLKANSEAIVAAVSDIP